MSRELAPERAARRLGQAAALCLAIGALVALRRAGAMRVSPAPSAPNARAPAAAHGVERVDSLIDRITSAVVDAGDSRATRRRLRELQWRSLTPPFLAAAATSPAVQFVALTTSAGEGEARVSTGTTWKPELRTWNMAEGSFDGRECLAAATPARFSFTMRVPVGARLETAPALVGLKNGAVTFEVYARPRGGARERLDSFTIVTGQPSRWAERKIALDAYAGHEIELELVTHTTTVGTEMPIALWGNPRLVYPSPTELPYNVLWFVVDALRPDVLRAWHPIDRDDRLAAAPVPPLDAWMPAMPTVAPHLDALAERGVAFIDASSAAAWTRPGTIAMLAGAHSGELGLDSTPWILPDAVVERFYASRPPLLAPILRAHGATTQAFVDNYFLSGYARAGIDAGFAGLDDERSERRDSERISRGAVEWLGAHGRERFFLFVNFNAPHHPYVPDAAHLAQVPPPPLGPTDPNVRQYLGEVAKDDDYLGRVLDQLDAIGQRERTIVVVTADHGETLSAAHAAVAPALDGPNTNMPMRFHHANGMFDETLRVPIIVALPGRLPPGRRVLTPAQTSDIAPTLLTLEGLAPDPKMTGVSLAALADGTAPENLSRVVFSEGRAARSVRVGRWRYVERDPAGGLLALDGGPKITSELYDLVDDPGERENIALAHPDHVAELREALSRALSRGQSGETAASESIAGSRTTPVDASPVSHLHFRFAGADEVRRIALTIELPRPARGAPAVSMRATPVDLPPEALHAEGRTLDAAFTTLPNDIVGFDLDVSPAPTPLRWSFAVDDAPIAVDRVFAGRYGLSATSLVTGLSDADARATATSPALPTIDPRRDFGVFITRDPSGDLVERETHAGETEREVGKLLEAWGYAARPAAR